jgi:hypothetical protein
VRKKNRTVDVTDNFSQIQNLPANNQFVGGEKKKLETFDLIAF